MTLELNRIELFNDGRDNVQPLTIFPINSSIEQELLSETDEKSTSYKHWSLRTTKGKKPLNKAPEITYHCIYCDQCFVELLAIYDHINKQHADLAIGPLEDATNEHNKINNDEDIDYSWVLEPICELIDLGEENTNDNAKLIVQNTHVRRNSDDSDNSDSETDSDDEDDNAIDDDDDDDEDNEDDDVDNNNPMSTNVGNNNCIENDEDSSSSSSTSSTTTTSTSSQDSTNSNALHLNNINGNILLNRTQMKNPLSNELDQNSSSVINQLHPILQSTSSATSYNDIHLPKSIELKINDPRESTSIILLNSNEANNNNKNNNSHNQSLDTFSRTDTTDINGLNVMNHALVNMMAFGMDQGNINGVNMMEMNMDTSTASSPSQSFHPALAPSSTTVIRRGRGRKSAAETAAMQLSSLNSNEPKCFQCAHCEASFLSAGDLSKHVRCHITNKPFQCSICEKTFTHIGSLNTHIRIHSGEKPYKCEICSKAFTQSSSLMVHVRSHSIVKPHQCHLCDKGFFNSSSLAVHLKLHQVNEIHSCQECDSTFKHESQLQEHMRTHTQVLLYQCSICQMAYASSSQLVQHMKCHMGEKPFTCSICDRSFTQSGSLNIHMRIHTGEKPFQCKRCDRSFSQASSLSVHMKMHLGEKPFSCNICGKCYSQSTYLNKHLQSHSMDHMQEPHSSIDQSSTTVSAEALITKRLTEEVAEQQGGIHYGNVYTQQQPKLQSQKQNVIGSVLVPKSVVVDGNSLSSLSSSTSSSSSSSLSSSSSVSSTASSALSSPKDALPLQETLLCIACGDLHPDAASLARHVNKQHSALIKNNLKDDDVNPDENKYDDIIRGEENDNAADHDLNQINLDPTVQQQQYIQQMQWIMQMQQHFMQNGNFVYLIHGLN